MPISTNSNEIETKSKETETKSNKITETETKIYETEQKVANGNMAKCSETDIDKYKYNQRVIKRNKNSETGVEIC